MLKTDVLFICNSRQIDFDIALENENVTKFLKKNKNNKSVSCQLRFNHLLGKEF